MFNLEELAIVIHALEIKDRCLQQDLNMTTTLNYLSRKRKEQEQVQALLVKVNKLT